jgi:integrase
MFDLLSTIGITVSATVAVAAFVGLFGSSLTQRILIGPIKQHMAGVLAMNPAREVKTERFSRTEGKTPAFVDGEVQKLLDAVDASTHTGLRDRALLGVLAYTFARIGAVVNLRVEDYYPFRKTVFAPL